MSLDIKAVTKIAKLSRIAVSDDEKSAMTKDLNGIFNWIEQLSEVDTQGIEPMAGIGDYTLRSRNDIVNDGNIQDDVLKNAPESRFGCYMVPKVID